LNPGFVGSLEIGLLTYLRQEVGSQCVECAVVRYQASGWSLSNEIGLESFFDPSRTDSSVCSRHVFSLTIGPFCLVCLFSKGLDGFFHIDEFFCLGYEIGDGGWGPSGQFGHERAMGPYFSQ
jgi:hypothetical protein